MCGIPTSSFCVSRTPKLCPSMGQEKNSLSGTNPAMAFSNTAKLFALRLRANTTFKIILLTNIFAISNSEVNPLPQISEYESNVFDCRKLKAWHIRPKFFSRLRFGPIKVLDDDGKTSALSDLFRIHNDHLPFDIWITANDSFNSRGPPNPYTGGFEYSDPHLNSPMN